MKVIVFGATGGTGSQLVARALELGHEVTAFARRPEAVTTQHERLRVAKGDAMDAASVAGAIAGQDVVLSALGPSKGAPVGTLISTGTRNILAGMKQHGVRRFVFESGVMVGEGRGLGAVSGVIMRLFRALNRKLYEDKVIAEREVRESGLDWIIVRPPALIRSPAKGEYRAGPDLDAKLTRPVSHADVADLMVKVGTDRARKGETLEISY